MTTKHWEVNAAGIESRQAKARAKKRLMEENNAAIMAWMFLAIPASIVAFFAWVLLSSMNEITTILNQVIAR